MRRPPSSLRRSSKSCASSFRWPRCISRTTSPRSKRSRSGCPASLRWPASTPAFTAGSRPSPSWFRCRATSVAPACSATAFTACRTNTSPRCCRRWRRRSRTARVIVAHLGSGASLCALKNRKERRSAPSDSPRSTDSAWARGPAPSIPGSSSTFSRISASPPRKSRRSSTRNPACSASPGSATTCATCSTAASRAARLAVDYFVYRAAKEIGALAAVLSGIDGLVFTAGIGENSAEDPPTDLRVLRMARHRSGRRGERQQGPAHLQGRKPSLGWVIPTNEELMIARHTGVLLGLIEARA